MTSLLTVQLGRILSMCLCYSAMFCVKRCLLFGCTTSGPYLNTRRVAIPVGLPRRRAARRALPGRQNGLWIKCGPVAGIRAKAVDQKVGGCCALSLKK